MSIVKRRIATFESKNSEVRTESTPNSPRHGLEVRVSRNQSDLSRVSGLTGPRSEGGMSENRSRSEVRLNVLPRVDMSDNASTTSNTSHLRRNRLQKETIGQMDESQDGEANQVAPASLAERRRARQQRKQLQTKVKQAQRSNGSTRIAVSNRDNPIDLSNASTNRVSKQTPNTCRQRPSPESSNRRPWSDQRVGLSITMASSSNSLDQLGEQPSHEQPREQRRSRRITTYDSRRHQLNQDYEEKATTELEFDQPSFIRHSPADPTDDEATLTSVRQIMHAPILPTLHMNDSVQIDQPANNMIRTTSSSSYDTESSRLVFDNGSSSSARVPPARDDDTFDYGDRDEYDSGQEGSVVFDQDDSVGFEEKRQAAAAYQKKESMEESSPLLTRADVEHYCRSLDTPVMKTAVSIVVAGTVGILLLGPVGLLVGTATVGIGVGVMQIPEEQRNNVKSKATSALLRAQESALNASEALSSTCAASCHEANKKLPMEMKQCFVSDEIVTVDTEASIKKSESGKKGDDRSVKGSVVTYEKPSPGQSKNRRVACGRNGRILPVLQIYGLESSQQPRAWLDVMAAANTTFDEKNEAMEEIINHSKDKQRARMLLDEGILDSIMYIINCYFDKRGNVTNDDFNHAKLAATCCVTLGKAHCAAVHTDGDLLLMSLYERGSVPEERQLAQMLYEVPHHVTRDGKPENFCLQQTSMPKAEDTARAIKALADGQQLPLSQ